MICPNCQSDNRDGAKFCNECGFPLSGKIAEVAAAAAAEEADRGREPSEASPAAPEPDQPEASPDPFPAQDEPGESSADGAPGASGPMPGRPGSSGPIDPAQLPSIDVAGVNVDEDGNAFDFSAIDGDRPSDEGGGDAAGDKDAGNEPSVTARLAEQDAARSLDDERLVDADYTPPQAAWRSGDTMEMPRVEGQEKPQQKEFRAPDPREKKKGRKGKAALIVLAVLAAAGLCAAGVTYYLELWGGKMLPDVVGRTQADATFVLEEKGFSVRASQVKSDETEGIVLLQDPSAGARQEEGTEVVIHVSVARAVPSVVGMQRDEAASALEQEGFENVEYVEQKSNEQAGAVLAVTPDPGSKGKASTPITVTVAVPFTVPDVVGMTWDEAKSALEAEGYGPEAAYVYDDSVKEGTAVAVDPAAGSELASGSPVTVSLAKSRGSELVAAAKSYLESAGSLSIGGTTYEIDSVDAVSYEGGETTSFTITGRAVTTLDGETVHGSAKQKSGTIVWNGDNEIVSVG